MLCAPSAILEIIECRFSSLLPRKQILNRLKTHDPQTANNNRKIRTNRMNYDPKKRLITSMIIAQITYSERASWELSIFSFLVREGRKGNPACMQVEMWEWKKRKGVVSVRQWRPGVEATCILKARLTYQRWRPIEVVK